MNRLTLSLLLFVITMTLTSCSVIRTTFSVIKTTYKTIKGTVKGTVWVVRGTYQLTKETTRLVYHIGMFTFEVVRAPLDYPLTRDDLQTIDGLPPKEAIRQGRVKNAPYTVKGHHYVPITVASAQTYAETGLASWNQEAARRLYDGQRRTIQSQRIDGSP